MATGGPSIQYGDVGGERDTNQGATISSGVPEIETLSTPEDSLILTVAEASHENGLAEQTCFSAFVDKLIYRIVEVV